jgi:hypothetical protein
MAGAAVVPTRPSRALPDADAALDDAPHGHKALGVRRRPIESDYPMDDQIFHAVGIWRRSRVPSSRSSAIMVRAEIFAAAWHRGEEILGEAPGGSATDRAVEVGLEAPRE